MMNPKKQLLLLIVLAFVIGGGAGILATAFTTDYLSRYATELGELTAPLRLSEERPRQFPQTYEEAVGEVQAKVSPGLVELFFKKGGVLTTYPSNEAIARGIVLTTDGWFVTVPPAGIDVTRLAVVIQGEVHTVEEVVPDRITGLAFVKVEASNLPVVAFGNGFESGVGEQIFLVPKRDSLRAAFVQSVEFGTEIVHASDRSPRRLVLDTPISKKPLGIPVANSAGELIGLVTDEVDGYPRIMPLNILLPSFTSLLREGSIQRSSLGIRVIDLQHQVGISDDLARGHDQGALIFGQNAIGFGSAGAAAGLQIGDIIISVDGQPINDRRSLDEYLLEYQVGETVALTVDRNGELVDLMASLQEAN